MGGALIRRQHTIAAVESDDADASAVRHLGSLGTDKHQADVDELLDRAHTNNTELLKDCVEFVVFADHRAGVRTRLDQHDLFALVVSRLQCPHQARGVPDAFEIRGDDARAVVAGRA